MNAPDLIDTCHAPALRGDPISSLRQRLKADARRERNQWIATTLITAVFSFLCALEYAGVIG